ncbi:hypothetical protein INP51_06345 [Blautia liquoris]|uniref:DUF1492 domain-containing protein n=1 Tax=Blautia liquoris TaxID=2779518 RepID=A0A7M2RJX3_9FIRM|nr:hypothetical protein [Blautia liquoris]QOV20559.1 hypothetical protein INP51_06345 [Blautia liquoris]
MEAIKMENDRKKEYLKSYQKSVREEQRIKNEIEQLRLDKMCPSVILDDMPHSHNQTDLSAYAAHLDDLLWDLQCKLEDKASIRREINSKISSMGCEAEKSVLWWRYIKGLKWGEIAKEMHYREKSVLKIHGKALINFPLNKVDTK